LVILDSFDITHQQALDFQNQANQCDENIKLSMVIVPPAIEAIKFVFASDPTFTMIPKNLYKDWVNHVTMKQAAEIVIKYFSDKTDGGFTLVETFSDIPIEFVYADRAVERETYKKLKTLTNSYSDTATISPKQHADLIVTIEKKLKADSQLRNDYFEAKRIATTPDETWEDAFTRLIECIVSVRTLNERIARYGGMYEKQSLKLRNSSSTVLPRQQQVARVPPIEQRSYAASVYAKQAGVQNTQNTADMYNQPAGAHNTQSATGYVKKAGVSNTQPHQIAPMGEVKLVR
jgi:hypothetical protein